MPSLPVSPFRLHREGKQTLLLVGVFLLIVNSLIYYLFPSATFYFSIVSIGLLLMVLQFFRNPARVIHVTDNQMVYAPADGKVVVIEEVEEHEYFKDKRLQISIFMSPLNVHVNRLPLGGKIKYVKHHYGKYLVAWHPKSSFENERCTTVIESTFGTVLIRQIAGALAKRIVNYMSPGQKIEQGEEMGFIKFGSRVDIFLPTDVKVLVKIGQKVKGNKDRLASL